jgi:hypothetical protein
VIHDARTAKYVDIIKKPSISVKGSTVSLVCATPGAKIYYSTDDSTPSFTVEHLYSKPFTVKKGAVVKAIAKIYGKDNSGLAVLELNDAKQTAR